MVLGKVFSHLSKRGFKPRFKHEPESSGLTYSFTFGKLKGEYVFQVRGHLPNAVDSERGIALNKELGKLASDFPLVKPYLRTVDRKHLVFGVDFSAHPSLVEPLLAGILAEGVKTRRSNDTSPEACRKIHDYILKNH